MEKLTIPIETEYITMSNLLKYSGLLETGGRAAEIIEDNAVKLNGVIIHEKRKKVYPNDVVILDNKIEITVVSE